MLLPQHKFTLGVIGALAALSVAAWSGWYLRDLQAEAANAAELRIAAEGRKLAEDVALRTERAIGAIRIENQIINNEVQREIRTRTVYRDCVLPADGVRLANEARSRAGQSARPVPSAASAPK
jgi:hypothetical protein